MVNITIDGIKYKVKDDSTILEAARANGVDIPSLCYFKDLNEIGACRICVVQVKGMNRLISSCNTKVKEGMAAAKMGFDLIFNILFDTWEINITRRGACDCSVPKKSNYKHIVLMSKMGSITQ